MENCKTIDGKLIAFPHGADVTDAARDKKEKNKAAPSILGGTAKPGDARVSKNFAKKQTKAKK